MILLCALFLFALQVGGVAKDGQVTVSLYSLWTGQTQSVSPTDPLVKLMQADPTIKVREWSGLNLPGAGGRTPLMMSIAGQTAPDLYLSWFHVIRNDIAQGFIYPLNDWVGDDHNGNGQLDPEEARWPGWKDVPPLWRRVATVDGKVYGIPMASTTHYAIVFRSDMVRRAGLDPNKPPKTWDEFFYWCQRLTDPGKLIPGAKQQHGQRAFAIFSASWLWLPWLSSAGGSPIEQVKASPTTGKKYAFSMYETRFRAPDTGEDLSSVPAEWRATLNSPEAKRAVAFYHKLRWQRWTRDPQTGEPVNLTNQQAAAGYITLPNGRELRFKPSEVITGVVRPVTGQFGEDSGQWFARGEVAAMLGPFDDLTAFASQVNPNVLGVFAVPAGPGAKPIVQTYRHYVVMSEGIQRRPKAERDKVWKVLTTLTSPEAYNENLRRMILKGYGRFISPTDLQRLGFPDYIREVPPSLRDLYAGMDRGDVQLTAEPYMGFWVAMDLAVNTNVLSLVLSDSGEQFDYASALDALNHTANAGTMFARKPEELAPYRPLAWGIFGVAAGFLLIVLFLLVRTNLTAQHKASTARAGVYRSWMPWLLLLPALGLVAVWGYYPLLRGMLMAFQDYHIVGKSPWVGLDNFINIFLNPDFLIAVRQTLKFVLLSLLLVFTAPIFLSLLLAEIPR
ncbi:MAG TPA: extracellular solute-binding protein, partial [Armatimonadota bacterium]